MRVSPSLHKKNPALWRNWWGSHHPHCRNRCLAMTSSFEIILDTSLLFVTGLFFSTYSWNWLVKVQKLMIRQRLSKEKSLESFCFSRSRCGGGWWQLLKCHLWGLVLDLQVRLYKVGFSTPLHLSDQSEGSLLKCWALIGQLGREKTKKKATFESSWMWQCQLKED